MLMGKTRGAPSNEWTGRQAFRAATPTRVDVDRIGKILDLIGMGDDEPDIHIAAPSPEARRKLIPRGPVPHHEAAPPKRYPSLHTEPLGIPEELRADLTPAAPSWPTSRELAHAYCEGHK